MDIIYVDDVYVWGPSGHQVETSQTCFENYPHILR